MGDVEMLQSRNVESCKNFAQYVAAITATIGGLSVGTLLGWTSPTQIPLEHGEYHFEVTEEEFSWIGGILSVGGMIGALGTGSLADKTGRKTSLILLIIPATVGWALLIWAVNPYMMMAGRALLGLAMTGYSVICPIYTSEISVKEIRGRLGSYFQLQLTIGILLCYAIGKYSDVFQLSVICSLIPIILAALMSTMPESPYYLLKKGNESGAKKALQWLRGNMHDIEEEMESLKKSIAQVETEKLSLKEAFSTVAARKGLVMGMGNMFLQQFSGVTAVIFYSEKLFKDAGSGLSESTSSIIFAAAMVIATIISSVIIDRIGRKPLLFLSTLFMSISSFVLGLYFFLEVHSPELAAKINFLPLLSVCVFIIFASIGFGPIPWMFVSEIFAPAIKAQASSICCLFNRLCTFLVTLFYGQLVNWIDSLSPQNKNGQAVMFWAFAAISAFGCLFVYFIIPETKGKSLDEIQKMLEGSGEDVFPENRKSKH